MEMHEAEGESAHKQQQQQILDDEESSSMLPLGNDQTAGEILPLEMATTSQAAVISSWEPSYSRSYKIVEFGFCATLFLAGFLMELLGVKPHQREIPYQILSTGEYAVNQMYNEEFVNEIITTNELILYGIFMPFLLQLLLSYFSQRSTCHEVLCVYLAALGITLLATDAIKTYAGYLRPIFYDQCVPDDEYQTCLGGEDVEDARKSFPSGHASISFCGLGLLSFYLERRFGASNFRNGDGEGTHAKRLAVARILSVLSKTPLLLAGYIAASRIVDNKHHPADVVGGATLGLSVSLWIHNIWYDSP